MNNEKNLLHYIDQPNRSKRQLLNKLHSLENLLHRGDLNMLRGRINENRIISKWQGFGKEVEAIIFTTYFRSKNNPQSEKSMKRAPIDSIDYIKPWYYSIRELGLYGIVFHDGLSDKFIQQHTTDCIHFVYCKLGSYSLNDERFIIYYEFLLRYPLKLVLMTDGNDVRFTKNPFDFMRDSQTAHLFIGRDNSNKIKYSEWNVKKMEEFEAHTGLKVENSFLNQPVYNAGCIGGHYLSVLYFMRQMKRMLLLAKPTANHNMFVFNYVIHKYWLPKGSQGLKKIASILIPRSINYKFTHSATYGKLRFFKFLTQIRANNKKDRLGNTSLITTSYPWNSDFSRYQEDSDAFVIHK